MTVVVVGGRRVVAGGRHQLTEDPGRAMKDAPARLRDRAVVL